MELTPTIITESRFIDEMGGDARASSLQEDYSVLYDLSRKTEGSKDPIRLTDRHVYAVVNLMRWVAHPGVYPTLARLIDGYAF